MTDKNIGEKMEVSEFKEEVVDYNITPQMIQSRFDLLRDLSEEQMASLNKQLVKRLDWRLMPIITLMFLMK
jgi:hypothetical protein